jgi:2-octaprenyl-6-methoxyphenol hydroxylase
VQDVVGWRHGRLLACGPRSRYPARRVVAQATIAPHAVLVGNAAQTLHPLGAQGFNLGLRDALTLAEEIAAAGRARLGDAAMLARHAARRAEDRERTLAFSDGFLRVGTRRAPWAGALRSLALMALDHPASLQAWLVGGAMGYRGDVPALCRADPSRRRA